jgi:Uma2 family endonuclease
MRRSYVMWKEIIAPLIAIEFVSGDGTEKRDLTSPFASESAKAGKFWVYEQAIHIPFYAIYEVQHAAVEVYERIPIAIKNVALTNEGIMPFRRWA